MLWAANLDNLCSHVRGPDFNAMSESSLARVRTCVFVCACVWPPVVFAYTNTSQVGVSSARCTAMDSRWICTRSILHLEYCCFHKHSHLGEELSSAERLHWSMWVLTAFLIHFSSACFPWADPGSRTRICSLQLFFYLEAARALKIFMELLMFSATVDHNLRMDVGVRSRLWWKASPDSERASCSESGRPLSRRKGGNWQI